MPVAGVDRDPVARVEGDRVGRPGDGAADRVARCGRDLDARPVAQACVPAALVPIRLPISRFPVADCTRNGHPAPIVLAEIRLPPEPRPPIVLPPALSMNRPTWLPGPAAVPLTSVPR